MTAAPELIHMAQLHERCIYRGRIFLNLVIFIIALYQVAN